MNVGELRALLAQYPDDVEVRIGGVVHGFDTLDGEIDRVHFAGGGHGVIIVGDVEVPECEHGDYECDHPDCLCDCKACEKCSHKKPKTPETKA